MIRHRIKTLVLCAVAVFAITLAPAQVTFAAGSTSSSSSSCPDFSDFLGFPNWYRGLQCKSDTNKNGITTVHIDMDGVAIPTLIWTVALNALDMLLRVAGILAVVMLLYNAYQYLTSAGQSDKISKAKIGLLHAVAGLAIAVLSSAIIYFVVGWVGA